MPPEGPILGLWCFLFCFNWLCTLGLTAVDYNNARAELILMHTQQCVKACMDVPLHGLELCLWLFYTQDQHAGTADEWPVACLLV